MSRIDKIVNKALDNVMENEVNRKILNQWWKDDFPCDVWYDENDLGNLYEYDLEIVQCDWVAEYIDYFVEEVCKELGLELFSSGTICHTSLVEELHEITKARLLDEVQRITEKIIVLQNIDFEQIKADMQMVCDRLNGCKTLQDISDYAIWNNDKLGVITSINFYDVDYPDIEEAIENNVEKEKISFICFSQLGEVNHLVFHFKDGKTNIDSVEFDIYDKEDKRICLQEMMLSNFIDNDKEDYER